VRNGLKLFWIVAMFATMGFLTGCPMDGNGNGNGNNNGNNGNGTPTIVRHYGVANGITFVLIITDGTNFELRVGTGADMKKSTGTATLGTGGVWTLTPYVDGNPADTFTITAGSDGIRDIEGEITFTDGTTQEAPENIAPIPPPGGGGNNNQPIPGTPISITITGIPAGYNNMEAGLFLFNTDMEPIASSWTPLALITAGNMSINLYHLIVLPNGDWEQGEPFGTAGDYVIWVIIYGDDDYVYETSRFINYGSNTIAFANNFQSIDRDGNGDNNGTGNYPPGTPISITITGIPAGYNNMGALLALFNTDMEPIAISDGGTPAIITAGNMSKSLYHWIVLPNGDWERGEPFGTAGHYVLYVVIFGDDYYEFVYETSRFINYGSNTIAFANNFQPPPPVEPPTPGPGTPITITIDGIPSAHNGLVGVIYLSTSALGDPDFDVVATSNDDTITNGSITLTFYDGYDVPFTTAGDYYVLFWVYTVDWDDDGNILDALLYGTARRRINYGTNPIPFAGNFQPITLD